MVIYVYYASSSGYWENTWRTYTLSCNDLCIRFFTS